MTSINHTVSLKLLYLFSCLFLTGKGFVLAQIPEQLYKVDYRIDPERKNKLYLEIDNLNFFKNNEYSSYLMRGYTLPGFRIQPRLTYQPQENIKLEAGVHALCFWGTDAYPNYAYQDIALWKSNHYQKGLHVLPFFRAQMTLSPNINIILGNLYGGSNHRLIEPLYSSELNLTADPETGAQVLFDSKFLHLDVWLNWESFIFYLDDHQEVFSVGLSSRIQINQPESRFHLYFPIQGILQHRGGDINDLHSVQTLMNGAAGVGLDWNTSRKFFKKAELEFAMVGYYQQMGEIFPKDTGSGLYVRAAAYLKNIKLKTSFWDNHDFISLFGSAMYGVVSTCYDGVTVRRPRLFYAGLEYSYKLGKGYDLGIDFDLYHHLSMEVNTSSTFWKSEPQTNYGFGLYFRLTPSFLLKSF